MTNNTPVENDEFLYRRIRDNDEKTQRHSRNKQDELVINPGCFYDDDLEPSVFIARLINCNPYLCRVDTTDGVVGFTAGEVNSIEIKGYKMKVFADPLDTSACHNSDEYIAKKAHAIICVICIDKNPSVSKKKAFYEMLNLLAEKAEPRDWILPPNHP